MKSTFAYAILFFTLMSGSVSADPGDGILTTYSQGGLHQLDFKMGHFEQKDQPGENSSSVGLGMGLTDSWFSELYLGHVKTGSDAIHFDSAALLNTFLLSSSDSPIDFGLYTEIEYENDRSAGEKISFGPLMQTEFGLTTVNLNFIFKRNYLADFSNRMLLDYQWQIKQHWNHPLDVGVQGFGEFGPWDHWAPKDQQSHRIGPALFGKIDVGDNNVINYNAAILFDVFDATHATTVRLQVVYGF